MKEANKKNSYSKGTKPSYSKSGTKPYYTDRKPTYSRTVREEKAVPYGEPAGGFSHEPVSENVCFGRNAVIELLSSGTKIGIEKIVIQKGLSGSAAERISASAGARGIPVVEWDRGKLDRLSAGGVHQGIAAFISGIEYAELSEILENAEKKGEKPFVILCDGITDPHNLGAIIRTAECAGAHGVVIPKRRGAAVTDTAIKASAGAAFHMPIAKVPNIHTAVEYLKENGLWIWAVDPQGEPYYGSDFTGGCALVLGGEGAGVSHLVKERSDFSVSIPMYGKIDSLNVSNACAVVAFEVVKQRQKVK